MDKKEIKFLRKKEYKFLGNIGRGGFGETILLEDEVIKEHFVCKKYSPLYESDKENYFNSFIQEIKLLYLLNHKNIVRIFNYHLYPEKLTGYILMEFINGNTIENFIAENPEKINDIFLQTIEGFQHLEQLGILHRDIRPQNILISKEGIVKIIDFGFGKQIVFEKENFNKSISINWRYAPPLEFQDKKYDFKTELYFIGKLFEEIINETKIENFAYNKAVKKMISLNYNSRISSFFDVHREILNQESFEIEFSDHDKVIYQTFADSLAKLFVTIYDSCEYNTDIELIIQRLENVYSVSMLEDYLQKNSLIVSCFLKGGYKYSIKKTFLIITIKHFITFFKSLSIEKRKIVLNNLWQRLDSIPRSTIPDNDDLPF